MGLWKVMRSARSGRATAWLRHLWRPSLLALALLLLLVSLGLDIYRQSTATAGVTSSRPYGPSNAPFDATLDVTVKKIDRRNQRATADVRIDVWRRAPYVDTGSRIRSLHLVLDGGGRRDVFHAQSKFVPQDWVRSSRCGVTTEAPRTPIFWSEGRDVSGSTVLAHITHVFCDVDVAIEASSALIYPFDTAHIAISPDGCADLDDCPGGGGLHFRKVVVALSDGLLQDENFAIGHRVDAGGITLQVRRHLFLRTMTVYVFVIVIVFLAQLIKLQTARELLPSSLGLLAAMWGLRELLIPSSVRVFPTLVDYAVLLGFGVVFLLLSFRLPRLEKSK
jgi:hypothetical protein